MNTYRGGYPDYLESPYWRLHVRRQALARAGGRCERCGVSDGLEVHHVTYERLGCEHPDDLEVLCGPCHGAHHGKPRAASRPRGPESIGSILPRVLAQLDANHRRVA